MTDFQLRQYDAERNRGDPIIVELQGARERRDGGKYASTLGNVIGAVRGVSLPARTRNMTPSEDGVRFKGGTEFQIVKNDLVSLGITEQDTKDLKFFHSNQAFRVVGQVWLARERIVRFFADRTRDDYPTLEGTWDFEDDEVGEEPAECTVDVPDGTSAEVALDGTNVVAMTSAEEAFPQVAINVLDVVEGPASSVTFKIKITGADEDGIVSKIILGEIDDIADLGASNARLQVTIERVAGALHLKDVTGLAFDTTIAASSWVTVEVVFSREKIMSVTVGGVELVDDIDVSAITASVDFVLFTGYAGSGATIEIDDVEVDCVAR